MRNRVLWITALVAAILVGGYFYSKYRVAPSLKFEKLAIENLQGQKMDMKQFKGKKVFVNFFATWCGPCLQELPLLQETQNILSSEFVFLFISDEPVQRLRAVSQAYPDLQFLHSEQKLIELDINSIPASYLLNEKLKVVFKQSGQLEMEPRELAQLLRKKLN